MKTEKKDNDNNNDYDNKNVNNNKDKNNTQDRNRPTVPFHNAYFRGLAGYLY